MRWIFLSPHYDDAVFSCGGGIWELCQSGEAVEVWTICGGQPPRNAKLSHYAQGLHDRWGITLETVSVRRAEDLEALSQLGAIGHSFDILDCIYRFSPNGQPLYTCDQDLFSKLHPVDYELIQPLSAEISQRVSGEEILVCPLGVGNHVDHQLTRLAAERVGLSLWYYAEIPYIFRHPEWRTDFLSPNLKSFLVPISQKGFERWLGAISAYRSQLSTFWESDLHLYRTLYSHWQSYPALELWQRSEAAERSAPAGDHN